MMKNQLAGLMKQAQQMQDNMKKVQDSLADIEVEGQSGAGLVKVVMTCRNDVRRIAIDHQLLRKEKTNTTLLAQILDNNLGQSEFFINKAIGWALRDYSKTNPEWVREYIESRREKMAALSIREASKYL